MLQPRKDQFSGCLIGQCLGDALGFPVEGLPDSECLRYVNEDLRQGNAGQRAPLPYRFGQYSDDSQLARELLISYRECRKFDPADYARRIAEIFRENRIVGRGRATTEAAFRLIDGVPWEEAGTPAPNAGNGSAMRASPMGLLFFDDPEQMVQAAIDQGRITHQDARCRAGSVAIAGATALAMNNATIDPENILSQLQKWVQPIHSGFSGYLRQLNDWLPLPPEAAFDHIAKAGVTEEFEMDWPGITPFVISSVLWSLYAFLKNPSDYLETIFTAIRVGGDVDTTAAMAGAISGAHLGLNAIPLELAEKLTDQESWEFAELVDLAEACYEIKINS